MCEVLNLPGAPIAAEYLFVYSPSGKARHFVQEVEVIQMANFGLNDAPLEEERPPAEVPPVEPYPEQEMVEAPVQELDDEEEGVPRAIDPAFVYIILLILALLGLSGLAADVRYTLLWALLTVVAVLAIMLDKLVVEPPALRQIALGMGFGALIGVPLLAVGAPQLQRISFSVFGKMPDAAVFQTLAFTMPMAETLYFRGAFQPARGLIFASSAAALWSVALFFPQLEVLKFPFVAVVIALSFLIANFIYGYVRARFGLFASWASQITANLLLLFVVRFL